MNVLILGAGYSGREIGAALAPNAPTLFGTTRSAEKAVAIAGRGITPLIYDGQHIADDLGRAMRRATHLIQSIAPGRDGDPMFRTGSLSVAERMPALEWVAYLSTVGVYGDHQGGWVTEDTACRPVSLRSRERVAAENAWLDFGRRTGVPVAILRLSGIYGPARNTFCNLADGTARRLVKPGQVFNRIRVEDIGRATAFLAERKAAGIFNITDDEPAAPQDVVSEAARLMGVAPPPQIAFETAELSEMARSFYGENKRVSNARIRALGFDFLYPDYRVSLAQLWRDGRWGGLESVA